MQDLQATYILQICEEKLTCIQPSFDETSLANLRSRLKWLNRFARSIVLQCRVAATTWSLPPARKAREAREARFVFTKWAPLKSDTLRFFQLRHNSRAHLIPAQGCMGRLIPELQQKGVYHPASIWLLLWIQGGEDNSLRRIKMNADCNVIPTPSLSHWVYWKFLWYFVMCICRFFGQSWTFLTNEDWLLQRLEQVHHPARLQSRKGFSL